MKKGNHTLCVTAEMSTTNPSLSIPVVDFGPFSSGRREDATAVGKALYEAFRDYGFAYVSNHTVPQDIVDEAFAWVCSNLSTAAIDLYLSTQY